MRFVYPVGGESRAPLALEGVVDVEILREPGKRLKGVAGSFARGAHVRPVGDDQAEALRRIQEGVRALSFTVRPTE